MFQGAVSADPAFSKSSQNRRSVRAEQGLPVQPPTPAVAPADPESAVALPASTPPPPPPVEAAPRITPEPPPDSVDLPPVPRRPPSLPEAPPAWLPLAPPRPAPPSGATRSAPVPPVGPCDVPAPSPLQCHDRPAQRRSATIGRREFIKKGS